MPFHGLPVDKNGNVGGGNNLCPWACAYDDCFTMEASSGYDFTATHYLVVAPLAQPTGVDPLYSSFPFVEAALGQYDISGLANTTFIDSAAATGLLPFPPGTVWGIVDGQWTLRISTDLFPTEHAYYLVGVGVGTAAVPGNLTDFMIVHVKKRSVDIFDVSVTGVDTTTLYYALGAAGHNAKLRNPTTISGVVATQNLRIFDRTLEATGTPSLEDADDDTGLDATFDHTVTTTPDEQQNVQQHLSFDT